MVDLEIMILTQPSREWYLDRLRRMLIPQMSDCGGRAALQIRTFSPDQSLGDNREVMRRNSKAEYICFVDDDDIVSASYVRNILAVIGTVDYVGFKVEVSEDGVPQKPAYHSLMAGGWWSTEWASYRDISHLNPMRRELALAAPMYGDFGEDSRWAGDIRRLGIVRSEYFINDTMYWYISRTDKTDGILPSSRSTSAGECPQCESRSTVRIDGRKFCNACAISFSE